MFKKVSLAVASMAVLTACSACSTLPEDGVRPTGASAMMGDEYGDGSEYTSEPVMRSNGKSTKVNTAMADWNMVQFGFDSAALSDDAQAKLRGIADYLKENKVKKVTIEGHCDERGTREYNLALGDRRAVSAKKFLVGLGVPSNAITTVSYGKERPMDAAHNAAAWAKNRRAVVEIQ